MGKNRLFLSRGIKNYNKRSVFPAAYKLVHLHTNFILKTPNKNPTKPNKIPTFHPSTSKILISPPISSNPTKINTFHLTHTPKSNPKSKSLSSHINTKIPTKSTFSPIISFSLNLPTNPHQNTH